MTKLIWSCILTHSAVQDCSERNGMSFRICRGLKTAPVLKGIIGGAFFLTLKPRYQSILFIPSPPATIHKIPLVPLCQRGEFQSLPFVKGDYCSYEGHDFDARLSGVDGSLDSRNTCMCDRARIGT